MVFLRVDQYTFTTIYSDFASKAACASADLTPACLLLRRIHAQQKSNFFDPIFRKIRKYLARYLDIFSNLKSCSFNINLNINFYLKWPYQEDLNTLEVYGLALTKYKDYEATFR